MIDPTSETWRDVCAWAKKEIETNQATLEIVGLEPVPTELARGVILNLRGLLKLGEPSKMPFPGSSESQ